MSDKIPGVLAMMIFLVPALYPVLIASKFLVLYFVRPKAQWQIAAFPLIVPFIDCFVFIFSFLLLAELRHGVLKDVNPWILALIVYFITLIALDAIGLLLIRSYSKKMILAFVGVDLLISPVIAGVLINLH